MAGEPAGRQIAFLVANEGIEQVELTEPRSDDLPAFCDQLVETFATSGPLTR